PRPTPSPYPPLFRSPVPLPVAVAPSALVPTLERQHLDVCWGRRISHPFSSHGIAYGVRAAGHERGRAAAVREQRQRHTEWAESRSEEHTSELQSREN